MERPTFYRFSNESDEPYMTGDSDGSLGPCGAGMVQWLTETTEITDACGKPSEAFLWVYLRGYKLRIPLCNEHRLTIEETTFGYPEAA